MLIRPLECRFTDVPKDVRARIREAHKDQLFRWADRIIDAPTLAAVFADES